MERRLKITLSAGRAASSIGVLVRRLPYGSRPAHQLRPQGALEDLLSWWDYRPKRTPRTVQLEQMYFGLELGRRLRTLGSTAAR
ncbi:MULTISPECIES: hypothetical protein [Streptomyces violaceusniger group]|uniref:hypothetical protein n=1 Tax=Streptomyces violaceusniger group TaxID=2839105 RepID=UPI001BAB42DA